MLIEEDRSQQPGSKKDRDSPSQSGSDSKSQVDPNITINSDSSEDSQDSDMEVKVKMKKEEEDMINVLQSMIKPPTKSSTIIVDPLQQTSMSKSEGTIKLAGRLSKSRIGTQFKSGDKSQSSQYCRSRQSDKLQFGDDMEDDEVENCVTISDENIKKMKADLKAQRARLLTKQVDEKHHKDQRKKNADKIIGMIKQTGIANYNRLKEDESSSNVVSQQNSHNDIALKQLMSQNPIRKHYGNKRRGFLVKKQTKTSLEDGNIMEGFIDYEKDTDVEIKKYRALGAALGKYPKQREDEDVQQLQEFFKNYKFFKELHKNHTPDTTKKVLQHIYVQQVEQDCYLFDEGDEADRFYIILKGLVGVDIAMERPVPDYESVSTQREKILAYLQCLYDNYEKVFWRRVPYANSIKNYLKRVKHERPSTRLTNKSSNHNHDYESKGSIRILTRSPTKNPQTQKTLEMQKVEVQETDPSQEESDLEVDDYNSTKQRKIETSQEGGMARKDNSQMAIQTDKSEPPQSKQVAEENQEPVKKLIINSRVELPIELFERLRKLYDVYDFSIFYLNFCVAKLPPGVQFGELAHVMSAKRAASIFMVQTTFLAYLEPKDYQRILKQATMADMQRQLSVIKNNRFFNKISSNKLQKLQYYVQKKQITKGKSIYSQKDDVDGMYLVVKGQVKYQKKIDVVFPVDSRTKNKWFKDQINIQGFNQKKQMQTITIFEQNEIVGFEELLRWFILKNSKSKSDLQRIANMTAIERKKYNIEQQSLKIEGGRDFTCVADSIVTEVMFFNTETLMPILKHHEMEFLQQIFRERKQVLQKAIDQVESFKNQISGAEQSKQIRNMREKEAVEYDYDRINPNHSPIKQKLIRLESKGFDLSANSKNNINLKNSQNNLSNVYDIPINLQILNRTSGIETHKTSPTKTVDMNQQMFAQANTSIIYQNQASSQFTNQKQSIATSIRSLNSYLDHPTEQITPNVKTNFQQNQHVFNKENKIDVSFNKSQVFNQQMTPNNKKSTQNDDYNSILPELVVSKKKQLQILPKLTSRYNQSMDLANYYPKSIMNSTGQRERRNFDYHQLNHVSSKQLTSQPSERMATENDLDTSLQNLFGQSSQPRRIPNTKKSQYMTAVDIINENRRNKNKGSNQKRNKINNTASQVSIFPGSVQDSVDDKQLSSILGSTSAYGGINDSILQSAFDKVTCPPTLKDETMEKILKSKIENKDSSQLYLKDLKTFLGLKKVAHAYTQKKDLANTQKFQKYGNQSSHLIKSQKGCGQQAILYHDSKQDDNSSPQNILDRDLNIRLCNVLQQLDTSAYLKNGETQKQYQKRVQKNVDRSMDEIEDAFKDMESTERKQGYQRKATVGDVSFLNKDQVNQRKKTKSQIPMNIVREISPQAKQKQKTIKHHNLVGKNKIAHKSFRPNRNIYHFAEKEQAEKTFTKKQSVNVTNSELLQSILGKTHYNEINLLLSRENQNSNTQLHSKATFKTEEPNLATVNTVQNLSQQYQPDTERYDQDGQIDDIGKVEFAINFLLKSNQDYIKEIQNLQSASRNKIDQEIGETSNPAMPLSGVQTADRDIRTSGLDSHREGEDAFNDYKENSKSDQDVSVLNEYVEQNRSEKRIDTIFNEPDASSQNEKITQMRNYISENQQKLKQLIHIQGQYQEMSNQMGEEYARQNNTMVVMLEKNSSKQALNQVQFAAAPVKSFDARTGITSQVSFAKLDSNDVSRELTSNEVTKGGLTIQALSDRNDKQKSPRVKIDKSQYVKQGHRNKIKELKQIYQSQDQAVLSNFSKKKLHYFEQQLNQQSSPEGNTPIESVRIPDSGDFFLQAQSLNISPRNLSKSLRGDIKHVKIPSQRIIPSTDKQQFQVSRAKGLNVKEQKNTQPIEALRQLKGIFDWNQTNGQQNLGDTSQIQMPRPPANRYHRQLLIEGKQFAHHQLMVNMLDQTLKGHVLDMNPQNAQLKYLMQQSRMNQPSQDAISASTQELAHYRRVSDDVNVQTDYLGQILKIKQQAVPDNFQKLSASPVRPKKYPAQNQRFATNTSQLKRKKGSVYTDQAHPDYLESGRLLHQANVQADFSEVTSKYSLSKSKQNESGTMAASRFSYAQQHKYPSGNPASTVSSNGGLQSGFQSHRMSNNAQNQDLQALELNQS